MAVGSRVWFTEAFLRSKGLSPATAAGRSVGRIAHIEGAEATVTFGVDCEWHGPLEALEAAPAEAVLRRTFSNPPCVEIP